MTHFPTNAVALLGTTLLISACASTPAAPSTEMTRAKSAIEQAERAGAREFANDRLTASMQKMELAQAAVTHHNNAEAARLTEESYADAHLAQVSAEAAKSGRAARDVDKSIDTLQRETNRPAVQ